MSICTIYKIINKIDGKMYIGQTWNSLSVRFNGHCNKKTCIKMFRAIQKYGKDSFTIEAVCYAIDQADADYWERHFIRRYDSINLGYNIKEGGMGGRIPMETRKKISATLTGKPSTSSTKFKSKLSDSQKEIIKQSTLHNSDLAKQFNVSYKTIERVRGTKKHLTPETIQQIKNDVGSYRKLAEKYNCSTNPIMRIKRGF